MQGSYALKDRQDGFSITSKFGGEHGIKADPTPKAHGLTVFVMSKSVQTTLSKTPAGSFGSNP